MTHLYTGKDKRKRKKKKRERVKWTDLGLFCLVHTQHQ